MTARIKPGNVYESQDPRDTDPTQPNGLRRVKVIRVENGREEGYDLSQVENLSTGRKTVIMSAALASSKWKLV